MEDAELKRVVDNPLLKTTGNRGPIELTNEQKLAVADFMFPRHPKGIELVDDMTDEAKESVLKRLFEDADASEEHVEKYMPRILAENLRRENELTERMKGYWIFKERD